MPGATTVRETGAMIAGMAPRLVAGRVAFVPFPERASAAIADALPQARALVREDEGTTLVLPIDHPEVPEGALALRQITCMVPSALDGIGLTAAIAVALTAHGIACNVIAGFHHDHLFVPADRADVALAVLQARAAEAEETGA